MAVSLALDAALDASNVAELAPRSTTRSCTLVSLASAETARITRLETPVEDSARLKALGLCVGRRVELVKAGDPLIVRVSGARVGLSARLAETVIVEPCTDR